jgi:hypothetical protein
MINPEHGGHGTSPEGSAATGWKVQFDVDMPYLGPLHGKVGLYGPRLDVTFWAESQETRTLFAAMGEELAVSLRELGFEIEDIQIRKGRPPLSQPSHGALMDWAL